jgi:hypothetical protein
MLSQDFLELKNSTSAPYNTIQLKEFMEGVSKAGSLISMIENKKINTTTLFSLLMENADYQKFFTEVTASTCFKDAIMSLLYLNPSLVKSKITKTIVRKISNGKLKPTNRVRKAPVQQASSSVKKRKKQAV